MNFTIEQLFQLADGMRDRGVLQFSVGDVKMVFGASSADAFEPIKEEILDEEDRREILERDLYWSATK